MDESRLQASYDEGYSDGHAEGWEDGFATEQNAHKVYVDSLIEEIEDTREALAKYIQSIVKSNVGASAANDYKMLRKFASAYLPDIEERVDNLESLFDTVIGR